MIVIKRLFVLSIAAISIFFAVSCSEETANVKLASKDNMIPDNAVLAGKVMPIPFWEKLTGNKDSDAYRLWNVTRLYLPIQINKYGKFGHVMKDAMDDPATLGINLNEPFILSSSADKKEICLVVLLADSKAFLKAADALVDYVEDDYMLGVTKSTEGSYTHYQTLMKDAAFDLGVTPESAVLRYTRYGKSGAPKDLKSSMSKLFVKGTNAGMSCLDLMDDKYVFLVEKMASSALEQIKF